MTTRKTEPRSRPARVISVTSGKGGVGKSHTTVNLGLALTQLGKRVLILDADLGLANINILLNFKPTHTLLEVVHDGIDIEDVIVSHPCGLDIIPATSGVTDMTHLSDEERITLIGAFDGIADEYDFMLVDTGAGIGHNVLYFNEAAEQVLVVIDQEPTSITDAYALIKVLSTQSGVRQFDIVVNRAPTGTDGRQIFAKLAAAADRFLPVRLTFLGAVAEDSSVVEAVVKQQPYLQLYPSTRASRDITRLARKISDNEGSRTPKGGVQFFFRALLEQTG